MWQKRSGTDYSGPRAMFAPAAQPIQPGGVITSGQPQHLPEARTHSKSWQPGTAPPVYRPQSSLSSAQRKNASSPGKAWQPGSAPPVYGSQNQPGQWSKPAGSRSTAVQMVQGLRRGDIVNVGGSSPYQGIITEARSWREYKYKVQNNTTSEEKMHNE